jgi:hypothetical protein
MKRLKSIENDQVALEVLECDCGFHLGIDVTFLDQVGDFKLSCPSCKREIDTDKVFPWDQPIRSAVGLGPFEIDTVNSDDQYLYVDVEGMGTVSIKKESEGIVVDVFPLRVVEEPVATLCAHIGDLV